MSFDLAELDAVLEHDSLLCRLSGVRVLDDKSVLELDLALRWGWVETAEAEGKGAGVVGLRCLNVEDWRLEDGWIGGIEIHEVHPALTAFEAATSRLSYRSEPAVPEAATAALHLAHAQSVGQFLDIARLLHPAALFPKGWSTGTVAEGPTTLMRVYADALAAQGVETTLIDTSEPESDAVPIELRVCVLGRGFVVATHFETTGELPTTSLSPAT